MKKIKIMSLFAGYGGAEFALQKADIDYEVVGYSEIDKFAIQCYEQNHDGKNYSDITQMNEKELPDFDLLTGGFPCQSFSIAGNCRGVLDSRGTLFWDILRIAKEKQPKYMLLENVKGLTTKRHKETFEKILKDLDEIGYDVEYKVLNAKHHGIPQNRDRIWFVCMRKDLNQIFKFPEDRVLEISLKDILEDEVDQKYYLNEKTMQKLQKSFENNGDDVTTKNIDLKQVNKPKHSNDRVYNPAGISPTLNTMQSGHRQPFIIDDTQGFDGVRIYDKTAPALRASRSGLKIVNATLQTNDQMGVVTESLEIRKLTPTECFRLMGFFDDEIKLDGLSNTQKYKLAGNGWTLSPASEILSNLLK